MAEQQLSQQRLDSARAHNLGHRLVALADDFSERVLQAYQKAGYPGIRPVHGKVLRNLELEGTRLTTLATRAGVTHRAMAKIVDDVIELSYVQRSADPRDRRATLVRYTPTGLRLLADSSDIIEQIYVDYSRRLGADRLQLLEKRLHRFLRELGIEISRSGQQAIHPAEPEELRGSKGAYLSHNLGRYLQLAGDDYHRRCAAIMASRGHPGIRFDHLSVLSHLDLAGMPMSTLADSAGITLQAIGRQARAVERMGYVSIRVDPGDARVRQVCFSTAGHRFISDLLAAFDRIDNDYATVAGPGRLRDLQASLAGAVAALDLRVPVAGSPSA